MRVAKTFRWESAHRLLWHKGECRNLHGHSYRMTVALDGATDSRGIVVDFKDIKEMIGPLVASWDHATLVADGDGALLEAVRALDSKHFVLPFDSTAENLCLFASDYLAAALGRSEVCAGIESFHIRIAETETCYAEIARRVRDEIHPGDHRTGVEATAVRP